MAYSDIVLIRRFTQGTTARKTFNMFLSADHISGATGKVITALLSKDGGPLATPQGTISELGFGAYVIEYTPNDLSTPGDLKLIAMAAGCDVTDETDEVVTAAEAEAALPPGANAPAIPTADRLIHEAFLRSGVPEPTEAQLLRAQEEWLEEAKLEIASRKRWHAMEETDTLDTINHQFVYEIPSPFERVLNMWVTDGDAVRPMAGPNDGLPRNGLVIGRPQQWEEFEHELYIYPNPGAIIYTLTIRGIVDPNLIDLNDARNTRINREWRNALLTGLMERIAEDADDQNMDRWERKKEQHIRQAMVRDSRMRRRLSGSGFRGPGGLPRWRTT